MRRRLLSSLPAMAAAALFISACGAGSSTSSPSTSTGSELAATQSPRESSSQQSGRLPGHPKIGQRSGAGDPSDGDSSQHSEPQESGHASKPTTSARSGSAESGEEQHEGATRASNRAAELRAKRQVRAARRELKHTAGKAAPFLVPVGDNSIPTYGSEASGSQLAAAEAALSSYLSARAEGAWGTACSLMSASVTRQLEVLAGEGTPAKQGCAVAYAKLSERVPAGERADPLTQGLTALRVESPHAFALFYGPGEQQYMMPFEEEGGGWKVTQIEPVPWPVGSTAR